MCNVLQHKKAQGIFYSVNMLHGCWTMEVQPFSQKANLQSQLFLMYFFFPSVRIYVLEVQVVLSVMTDVFRVLLGASSCKLFLHQICC